ncbi:hypothetical protein OSB04_008024 [Centaurea solstitialis]|uniref:RRM domain-containing protein n=1 Tax=Centaurea solstitialis TaxID=347529 RepID=A0AA38WSX1_9ASTR|nr:hypothetical protein OSB04_008024 [Centaurea solstitialis]
MADSEMEYLIDVGKRGPKEVVETEVLGSKKQKIVNGDNEQAIEGKNSKQRLKKRLRKSKPIPQKNIENDKMVSQPNKVPSGAVESGSVDKEETHLGIETCHNPITELVEVRPAIKSATTSQDGNKACGFNESKEDGDDNSKKEANQHLETPNKCVEVPPTNNSAETTQDAKRASSSNEYEEKDGDDNPKVDDQHLETPMKSDTDVEMVDASSEKQTQPQSPRTSHATGSKTLLMSNLSFMIKEEDVRNFFKNVGEIAEVHFHMREDYFTGQGHVEFANAVAAQEALRLNNELLLDKPVRLDLESKRGGHPHSATTPSSTGSKTLYLGNLSFSIEEDDVRDFFKDVGEIAEIRFAIKDDRFLGYGHVDFTTAEAAQEALKLNSKVILDRRVKLDLARERGAYTSGSSMEKSNQKGGQGQAHGKTIFVRGFDSSDGFENIRCALEKHFGKCGEISRMSIPKDYESGTPKGVAFIDFVESNGFSQALELDGSSVGGSMIITIREVKIVKSWRDEELAGNSSGVAGVEETAPVVAGVVEAAPVVAGVEETAPVVAGVVEAAPVVAGVEETAPVVAGVEQAVLGVAMVEGAALAVAMVEGAALAVAGVEEAALVVDKVALVVPMVEEAAGVEKMALVVAMVEGAALAVGGVEKMAQVVPCYRNWHWWSLG